jgi:MFS superfamily sulfate permease-like transporter
MQSKAKNINLKELMKDTFISGGLFILFCFIDLKLAFFISLICFAILWTRTIILDLNPGAVMGHKIYFKGKELFVPETVDIFDVGNDSSFDNLSRYAEIIRQILIPPRILIIRFNNKYSVTQFEVKTLIQIIKRLKTNKILVLFSDVNVNLQNQFRENGIAGNIGEENIFYYIKGALKQIRDILKSNRLE